jgi:hypothetical protein
MTDEAPDDFPTAIKGWIGAFAFIVTLIGAELVVERDGKRLWIGLLLVCLGLPIMTSVASWKYIKPRLRPKPIRRFVRFLLLNPVWIGRIFWVPWLGLGLFFFEDTWTQGIIWSVVMIALWIWTAKLKYDGLRFVRRRFDKASQITPERQNELQG